MPAPKPLTMGQRLRHAAEQLIDLADLADLDHRSLPATQQLHDGIETVAGDVRAVVRGRR